ncbi:MAG: 2-hydroxyacid dehydrogenase [Candidatus Hodarchaeota archaeon]
MKSHSILLMEPLPQPAHDRLKEVAEVRISPYGVPCPKDGLIKELSTVDGVIADGTTPFDRKVVQSSPRLKIIARNGVGYDNVDVLAATDKGIFVTNTPGVLSNAVAELTLGLILCLSRRICKANDYVRNGTWVRGASPFPFGFDLYQKTLGIVGLGRIGLEVAKRAQAFKMALLYFDPVRNPQAEKRMEIRYVPFEDLLRESDIVSLHLPLSPKTERIIGQKELRMMKPSAYLINTARGRIIDQSALCQALQEGWIAGAALDVLEVEPPPREEPLPPLDNTIITPHIGTATVETRKLMALTAADDVIRVLKGERPVHLLNQELLR